MCGEQLQGAPLDRAATPDTLPLGRKLPQEMKWALASGLFPTGRKQTSWEMGQGRLVPSHWPCMVGLVRKPCYLQKIGLGTKNLGLWRFLLAMSWLSGCRHISLFINLSINNNEYWMLKSTAVCFSVWISLKLLFVFYSPNLLQLPRYWISPLNFLHLAVFILLLFFFHYFSHFETLVIQILLIVLQK